MKRDMNYLRSLMFEIEEKPAHEPWTKSMTARNPDDEELTEYLRLLLDADFIRVHHHIHVHGGEIWDGVNLTSAGHDFLDNIRSDTVWAKTMERANEVGGKVSLSVISELAGLVLRNVLHLG